MKYQHLTKQNESLRKQIDEQNKLIQSQINLIDKLTTEKMDLLSKLEIKKLIDKRVNPFKQKIMTVSTAGTEDKYRRYYDKPILDLRIRGIVEEKSIESLFLEKKKEIEKSFMLYDLKK
jgi:hypothetical protein